MLTRNPNYHGNRPHRFDRIELKLGIPAQRAVADIEAGTADYATIPGRPWPTHARSPRTRRAIRPRQPGREHGDQQLFRKPHPGARLLRPEHPPAAVQQRANPTGRQLRGGPRRAGRARRAGIRCPASAHRSIPAARDPRITSTPHLSAHPEPGQGKTARERTRRQTAVLYTCDTATCSKQAQILDNDLAAIDLHVAFKTFPHYILAHESRRPASRSISPTSAGPPTIQIPRGARPDARRPAQTSRRSMTRATAQGSRRRTTERPRTLPRLRQAGGDLARNAAPLTAYDNPSSTSCSPSGWAARPTGSTASTSPRCASSASPAEHQRRGPRSRRAERRLHTRIHSSGRQAPADEECEAD